MKAVAALVVCVMAALALNIVLRDGMGHGAGIDVFLAGARNPWQLFINQDLISGLLLALSWIIFRQAGARTVDTVAWVWLALYWGNIVVASYVLVAASQSRGRWDAFFLGGRVAGSLHRVWCTPSAVGRAMCLLAAAICGLYMSAGILAAGFRTVATLGYVLGFSPIVLSLILLGFPGRPAS